MAADSFPDRAAIAQAQLARLNALLGALVPANPFYARKLAGLPRTFASLEEFSQRVPFTTKNELADDQRAHPPYGSNLTFPPDRYVRCHQTSGSSGEPLRWLDTPESWDWILGNWEQVFRAADVTRGDRVFCAFSFGPFLGFWAAFEAASRLCCLVLPGGGLNSAARLRMIFDHGATVLCCTPTYAAHLAEVAAGEKIDLGKSPVKKIIVAGEPGGSIPATRRRLEELWPGARVFDHHGMTEVGPVTFECPVRPGVLHVIESSYVAEIVDPQTGLPVAAGHEGELVLTNLGRTGSPLLRYRTGDLVKSGSQKSEVGSRKSEVESKPCACGRFDLALAGGILGRTDDMIVVRGVNVYPSAVEEIIRAQGGVAEYQVKVLTGRALAELSVQVEPAPDCADVPVLIAKLEQTFHRAFALRVPVTAVPAGALPRFELKAKRWVRS